MSTRPDPPFLICPDCGAAQIEPPVSPGGSVRCFRCAGVLFRAPKHGLEHALALTIGGALFLVLANGYPPLGVLMQGHMVEPTLIEALWLFYERGSPLLTAMVFIGVILLPLLQAGLALYLLLPVWLGQVPPFVGPCYRLLHALKPWSQLDIMLLGVLVAMVKLKEDFEVHPLIGLPFLIGAIVLPLLGGVVLEGRVFWQYVEANRGRSAEGLGRAR